jgi:hypothetical protein
MCYNHCLILAYGAVRSHFGWLFGPRKLVFIHFIYVILSVCVREITMLHICSDYVPCHCHLPIASIVRALVDWEMYELNGVLSHMMQTCKYYTHTLMCGICVVYGCKTWIHTRPYNSPALHSVYIPSPLGAACAPTNLQQYSLL